MIKYHGTILRGRVLWNCSLGNIYLVPFPFSGFRKVVNLMSKDSGLTSGKVGLQPAFLTPSTRVTVFPYFAAHWSHLGLLKNY